MKDVKDYIGITRQPLLNIKSSNSPQPPKSFIYKVKDFFTSDTFGWLFHTFWVKKRYQYPSKIVALPVEVTDVKLGIVADWASGTVQAEWVGNCIKDKDTDLTIHLGDTYYSGAKDELDFSFGAGNGDNGIWPRGKLGSFALSGNHEMFSSGAEYYNMITSKNRGWGFMGGGQEAPVFCIKTSNWCILGLDTGYDSLKRGIIPVAINPNNTKLQLQSSVINWLTNVVNIQQEQRNIVVLTHHQYITAFNGEDEFSIPAAQLKSLLPENKEVIWIWGHEHRFSIYNRFKLDDQHIAAYGRCIGHGGMPDEHTPQRALIPAKAKTRNLLAYDSRVAETFIIKDKKLDVGGNGYAILATNGQQLTITYYSSYQDTLGNRKDEILYTENWLGTTGLTCTSTQDAGKLTFIK